VNTDCSTAAQERNVLVPNEMLASRMMCFMPDMTRRRPLLYADFLQQAAAMFR